MKSNLKKIRVKKGFTQAELASMSDISHSTISLYERNNKIPGKRTALMIASALGVKADAIWPKFRTPSTVLNFSEKKEVRPEFGLSLDRVYIHDSHHTYEDEDYFRQVGVVFDPTFEAVAMAQEIARHNMYLKEIAIYLVTSVVSADWSKFEGSMYQYKKYRRYDSQRRNNPHIKCAVCGKKFQPRGGYRKTEKCCGIKCARKVSKNTRSKKVTAYGKTMTLAEWSKETGINKLTISKRINRGWPVEMALETKPIDPKSARGPKSHQGRSAKSV